MADKTEETPTRTGEGFGEAPPGHGHEAFTDEALFDEAPSVEAPAATTAPAAEAKPPRLVDDLENLDTVGASAYKGTEEGPSEEDRRYAGRYKSVEDLEAGYKNIQRLQSRTDAEKRAAEERVQRYEAAIQQMVAGRQSQQQPQVDVYNPASVQQFIAEQIRQGTGEAAQQLQREQLSGEMTEHVNSFRQAYPDVAPGSELDDVVARTMVEFQQDPESGQQDMNLFPVTRENLEIAYVIATNEPLGHMVRELDLTPTVENLQIATEAIKNPALAEVLVAEPELLDTDAGLNHARRLANLPGFYEAAQQQVQPPSGEQIRRAAYVETGGSGAPAIGAPGTRPDEMDEAIASYRRGQGDSVFTGWRAQ